MGRWSQRKRRGGGVNELNYITHIQDVGGDSATFDYRFAINGPLLNAASFESNPSAAVGISIIQNTPTQIVITFNDPIAGDTSVTYSGSTPGIRTPQTIAY